MIDDWTGHKYITSHRCFGSPCPKDLIQMRDEDTSDEDEDDEQQVFLNKFNLHPTHLAQTKGASKNGWQEGLFHMGDLQEHKYNNPNAWIPGAMPHADYDGVENLHSIIYDHFDPKEGRFLSDHEVQHRADVSENEKEYAAANSPRFTVPGHVIDDWTGERWAKNIYSYGIEPHPPVDVKTKEEHETEIKEFQDKLK